MFNPEYQKQAYSARDALAFAEMSRLVYDIKKNPDQVEQTLKYWGFSQYQLLSRTLGVKIDTQCAIASDETAVVVSFCGSESLLDWFTNLAFVKDAGIFPGSRVHEGFQDALFCMLVPLGLALEKLNPDRRKQIWITGHSLGGALAVLFTALLLDSGEPVTGLYTFGAPRVGDHPFAQAFDRRMHALGAHHHRVVNQGDLVPHVPPEFLHYSHTGRGTRVIFMNNGRRRTDYATWKRFQRRSENLFILLRGWLGHLGIKGLAVMENHLLGTPESTGYIARLVADLQRSQMS